MMQVEREESSVAVRRNECGEIIFACDRHGPVISRTPEELGIPRVVSAEPAEPKLPFDPDPEWKQKRKREVWNAANRRYLAKKRREELGARAALGGDGGYHDLGSGSMGRQRRGQESQAAEAAGASAASSSEPSRYPVANWRGTALAVNASASASMAAAQKVELRTIRGVDVAMPANATMGAEMIDLIAEEDKMSMGRGKYGNKTPPEVLAEILANADGLTLAELAAKHDVSISTVSAVRSAAKRAQGGTASAAPPKTERPVKQAAALGTSPTELAPVRAAARVIDARQHVEIDAARPGAASALLDALAKQDVAVAIRFDLSPAEVGLVFARMGEEQKQAFLSAGLKAALLG